MIRRATASSIRCTRDARAITTTLAGTAAATAIAVASAPQASADIIYDTIVLTGDDAPGTDDDFRDLSDVGTLPVLNVNGQLSFRARLTGDGGEDRGIWSGFGGSLSLIAREGHAAPDGSGETFGTFSQDFHQPVLSDSGLVAFWGDLSGTGNDKGIWRQTNTRGAALIRVVLEGDTVGSHEFDQDIHDPVINASGLTAFWADVNPEGSVTESIWKESSTRGAALTLVAKEGDNALLDNDDTFTGFGDPVLNDSNQTAFRGQTDGDNSSTSAFGRKAADHSRSSYSKVMMQTMRQAHPTMQMCSITSEILLSTTTVWQPSGRT